MAFNTLRHHDKLLFVIYILIDVSFCSLNVSILLYKSQCQCKVIFYLCFLKILKQNLCDELKTCVLLFAQYTLGIKS